MHGSGDTARTPGANPGEAHLPASASALLQRMSDRPGDYTLKSIMSGMHQQSFGMLLLLMALLAAAPVISVLGGFLLLVIAVQMICGCEEPKFPAWLADRPIPKRHFQPVLDRAIPILTWLETIVHPRFVASANATKRIVGTVTLLLAMRLLIIPLPMSNVPPSALIALTALAYLEQDGLLLLGTVLAACILFGIELGVASQLGHGAEWIKSALH